MRSADRRLSLTTSPARTPPAVAPVRGWVPNMEAQAMPVSRRELRSPPAGFRNGLSGRQATVARISSNCGMPAGLTR